MDTGLKMNGGSLNRVPPTASTQEIAAATNDIVDRLNGLLKTTVQSDGTNKRYLNGYQKGGWPGGDFGVKISIAGVDVTTANDTQLLFSWDYTTNRQIFYDPTSHLDVGHQGVLLNGKSGSAWAKDGESVTDAFAG